ncbi:hypothetical protein ACEPUD_11560 [Burkholderia ubonensis]|uniref:hypothetical protein n=1 Tax=Burkholderia ubonensis TaxID=101571 RepID=UPI00358F86D7
MSNVQLQAGWPFASDFIRMETMKEPGLDGRHRNQDGRIRQKRSDTENQNLPQPIPGFPARTTLDRMRRETGKTSEKDIRNAVKPKK